jgi:Fe-Mn family superoxide dismutase
MANHDLSRRAFIHATGKASVVAGLTGSVLTSLANGNSGNRLSAVPEPNPYKQQPLPYAYAALEPAIDAQTMEIHYTKHAATYARTWRRP